MDGSFAVGASFFKSETALPAQRRETGRDGGNSASGRIMRGFGSTGSRSGNHDAHDTMLPLKCAWRPTVDFRIFLESGVRLAVTSSSSERLLLSFALLPRMRPIQEPEAVPRQTSFGVSSSWFSASDASNQAIDGEEDEHSVESTSKREKRDGDGDGDGDGDAAVTLHATLWSPAADTFRVSQRFGGGGVTLWARVAAIRVGGIGDVPIVLAGKLMHDETVDGRTASKYDGCNDRGVHPHRHRRAFLTVALRNFTPPTSSLPLPSPPHRVVLPAPPIFSHRDNDHDHDNSEENEMSEEDSQIDGATTTNFMLEPELDRRLRVLRWLLAKHREEINGRRPQHQGSHDQPARVLEATVAMNLKMMKLATITRR